MSPASQALGSLLRVVVTFAGGLSVCGPMRVLLDIHLSQEGKYCGADLLVHKIDMISHR